MANWTRARIGDLCDIVKGETGLASSTPGSYPLVATGADRRSCESWQFDTEAVCIPLVSSTGHGKKTLNYVHFQSGKFAVGTILAAVIPKDPTVLTARFLHLYLSHFKDSVLVPLMKGAANVSLSMKEIASIEIPVPPLDEQQSLIDLIFHIEDEHRDLLKETNRQGELLKQLRQALLQDAVEGKLTTAWRKQNPVVKGDPLHDATALLAQMQPEKERLIKAGKIRKEKPPEPITENEKTIDLPNSWVWCRLAEICDAQDPNPSHRMPKYVQNGTAFISPVNVNAKGKINFSIGKKVADETYQLQCQTYSIMSNSFAFSRIGTIGSVFKLPLPQNYCLSHSLSVITPIQDENEYLMRLLSSPTILRQATHGVTKNTVPDLGMKTIRSFVIPMPPLAEQFAIVTRVDSLMATIYELEEQVAERKEQAQLLMQTVLREAFNNNVER